MDQRESRIRILWGSPLPPARTGVSDYAMEILPELAKLTRVRVLRPPGWSIPDDWPADLEIAPTESPAHSGEITLIHLGNNHHHLWLTERLRSSVVVVHDAVLHHLLVEATAASGDHSDLERRLVEAHGDAGAALSAARRVGIQGRLDPFLFPARRTFLAEAKAVLVHSRWAEDLIRREEPDTPIGRVGLTVADPSPTDRSAARSRLGLTEDETVLMHLGFLTPEKGIGEILAGLAAADRIGVAAKLVVVGEGESMTPLESAAVRLGVRERVLVTGWVEPEFFPRIPAAADLGVVFRTPSAGETSAAALRFLACGVPVAVGGRRQFLEWPEAAAPRLTPGASAAADLARILASVGTAGWEDRRFAARSAYENGHRPQDTATQIVDYLHQHGASPPS